MAVIPMKAKITCFLTRSDLKVSHTIKKRSISSPIFPIPLILRRGYSETKIEKLEATKKRIKLMLTGLGLANGSR